jgi:Arc/MetJ-type ribon-helix-helix transcriptional regulator
MAKVMISLPDDFLARVDRAARAEHRSRSELIREALRQWLEGREEAHARSWEQALRPLRELEGKWIGRWDSTDIIRRMRDTRYG